MTSGIRPKHFIQGNYVIQGVGYHHKKRGRVIRIDHGKIAGSILHENENENDDQTSSSSLRYNNRIHAAWKWNLSFSEGVSSNVLLDSLSTFPIFPAPGGFAVIMFHLSRGRVKNEWWFAARALCTAHPEV